MINAVKNWIKKAHKLADPLYIENLPFRGTTNNVIHKAELTLVDTNLVGFYFMPNSDQRFLRSWLKQEAQYLTAFDEVWLCITIASFSTAVLYADSLVGLLVVDNKGNVVNARNPNTREMINRSGLVGILNREKNSPVSNPLKTSLRNNPMLQHIRQASTLEQIRQVVGQ